MKKEIKLELVKVSSIPPAGHRPSEYVETLENFLASGEQMVEVKYSEGFNTYWSAQDTYAKLKYRIMKNNLDIDIYIRDTKVFLQRRKV